MAELGFDARLWQDPSRLTLLVLASRLFADQSERVSFLDAVVAEGRAVRERVALRRPDGKRVLVTADGRVVQEAGRYVLRLALTPFESPDRTPGAREGAPEGPPDAERARIRSYLFDRLAVPEPGRTADRLARFLDWVIPRRTPLLVVGEEGTGASDLVEAVHESRSIPGSLVRSDAELERSEALAAMLERHYGSEAPTGIGGLFIRRMDATSPVAQHKAVSVAVALARGEVVEPLLYFTAMADAPIIRRLADEGGVDVFTIPPLRDRPQDIAPVLSRLLRRPRVGLRIFQLIHPETAQLLQAYDWPGNVEELREVSEAARVISGGRELRPEDLPMTFLRRLDELRVFTPVALRRRVPKAAQGRRGRPEKKLTPEQIREAIEAEGGSRTNAARRLGVSRTTLWRKIAELGEGILEGPESAGGADRRDADEADGEPS